MSALPDNWRRPLGYVWLAMAIVWFALAMNWVAAGEHLHGAVTAAVGIACWFASEIARGSSAA